jgi:hypothetical protein
MTYLNDLNRDHWMDDDADNDDAQSLSEFCRQIQHQDICEHDLKVAIDSVLSTGCSKGRCSILCETFIKEWK